MLTPEQIALLTPEELPTAERWEREKDERNKLMLKFEAGEIDFKTAVKQGYELTPRRCEHDRDIRSNCSACEKIECKLYPELDEEAKRYLKTIA